MKNCTIFEESFTCVRNFQDNVLKSETIFEYQFTPVEVSSIFTINFRNHCFQFSREMRYRSDWEFYLNLLGWLFNCIFKQREKLSLFRLTLFYKTTPHELWFCWSTHVVTKQGESKFLMNCSQISSLGPPTRAGFPSKRSGDNLHLNWCEKSSQKLAAGSKSSSCLVG